MIPRWKAGLGLAAGFLLSISSDVHSSARGQDLRSQLEGASTSLELTRGLMLSWHFLGIAIVRFGMLALALVERNPFYVVFVLPGGLLLLACGQKRRLIEGSQSHWGQPVKRANEKSDFQWGLQSRC